MSEAAHLGDPTAWRGWDVQAPLAWMSAAWDVWSGVPAGRQALSARAGQRLRTLVEHARTRSPFYRDHYLGLPRGDVDLPLLPPVTRHALMARFDDWVADPDVTAEGVLSFVADPDRTGQPYLGRYGVWTSSGTAGEPGLFVHDANALAVYDALEILRPAAWPADAAFYHHVFSNGARYAMVAATGGHFAGVASIERMRRLAPWAAGRMRVFSILQPLPRLVAALNGYAPTFLATYPTAASLLAAERAAGRLAIAPSTLWLGGETLTDPCRAQIARDFGCRVLQEYGTSECMSIACECPRGRLHLNSDWVFLEPVDREYRPVPPGTLSHTTLLTNLANLVQPMIRYDLGDSIRLEGEPCACGNPLPVLRVEGRSDDTLKLQCDDGSTTTLLPLALTTVVEETGLFWFQIVQSAPKALGLRLDASEAAGWDKAAAGLRRYLEGQGLSAVQVLREAAPPERNARSGKLRRVIAL